MTPRFTSLTSTGVKRSSRVGALLPPHFWCLLVPFGAFFLAARIKQHPAPNGFVRSPCLSAPSRSFDLCFGFPFGVYTTIAPGWVVSHLWLPSFQLFSVSSERHCLSLIDCEFYLRTASHNNAYLIYNLCRPGPLCPPQFGRVYVAGRLWPRWLIL